MAGDRKFKNFRYQHSGIRRQSLALPVKFGGQTFANRFVGKRRIGSRAWTGAEQAFFLAVIDSFNVLAAAPAREVFNVNLKSLMKFFIRYFFRTLRIVLSPFMLLKEKLTQPNGIVRPQVAQEQVDRQCQSLALYQYKTCPFCAKVRREIGRLSLNIKRVDAQPPGPDRDALTREGGQTKVPCLRITDAGGKSQWLYDSEKIVEYLRGRFVSL